MSAVTTKAHHQLLITSSVRIIVGRLELLNINGILIFRPRYGAVMSMSKLPKNRNSEEVWERSLQSPLAFFDSDRYRLVEASRTEKCVSQILASSEI